MSYLSCLFNLYMIRSVKRLQSYFSRSWTKHVPTLCTESKSLNQSSFRKKAKFKLIYQNVEHFVQTIICICMFVYVYTINRRLG